MFQAATDSGKGPLSSKNEKPRRKWDKMKDNTLGSAEFARYSGWNSELKTRDLTTNSLPIKILKDFGESYIGKFVEMHCVEKQ